MRLEPSTIIRQAVSKLRANPQNARTHSGHQVRQIAASIRAFGFTNPVLVDAKNQIVAGHGRVAAAKLLGVAEVPTLRLDQLSKEQIRAYVIADNRIAENADWDLEILAIELEQLLALENLDIDMDALGFEVAEIDVILGDAKAAAEQEDELPIVGPDQAPVTEPGDLWLLGKHRLLCGNALHAADYRKLLGNKRAAAVFTDPPFNVVINGHATGNGAIRHREFAMASGELSEAEYSAFLNTGLRLLAQFSTADSVHYLCIDWRHVGDMLAAGKQNYDELLNLCVWVKDNGGMGSFYRSRHELVLVFGRGKKNRNNIQLGRFGRNRTNVWEYPGVQTQSRQGEEGNLLALHPTVKPIRMIADAILDCTSRGQIVLDPFLGSGTTLLATERVGRICHGVEIDPLYVDIAIRRWQQLTGESAVLAGSSKSFNQVSAERTEEQQ